VRTRVIGALVTLAAALAVAVGAGPASADSGTSVFDAVGLTATPHAAAIPPIRHVFIIVLENESESDTFGPGSPAPYLSQTLPAQGAFLPNYFGIGHNSLDNYIAMIGGQPPTPSTSADCGTFTNFPGGSTVGSDGVESGDGCVYPANVPTIASQLTASGLTWKGYMDSMGADPARETATCGHPAIGAPDLTQTKEGPPNVDTYATRHDPFVYYHSIIDDQASCAAHVVNLSQLPADLSSVATTPNYSFITPGLCNDGHDSGPSCPGGGGLPQADSFLQAWVPMITSSPAFQQDGLLLITFDESEGGSPGLCCGEIPGPTGASPAGGGDTGAVMLSPFIAPGTVSQTAYNHYSMLGSMEDIFGLSHLGYAQLPGETDFGADVYTKFTAPPAPGPAPAPAPGPTPPAGPTSPSRLTAARAAAVRARAVLTKAEHAFRASAHGHSTRRTLTALERLDAAEVRLAHANASVLTAAAS
jgi:hypothetical protein